MRSPRFLRPHDILIKNKISEVDGDVGYQVTSVKYVCVDAAHGMKQSQKGIEPTGDLLVIMDMNDLIAFEGSKGRSYKEPFEFEKLAITDDYFTLRPDVDIIVYKGIEYTVNSIGIVNPVSNEPSFLEITANE